MRERQTWGLVVATYKRHEMLRRCLRASTQQTVPASEIIVVDASPDSDEVAEELRREFGQLPNTRFSFVKANRASLTHQRNQGIALASADVVFLIDDDSLMYPDCAEEIMKVYDQDTENMIMGVSAVSVPVPPDVDVQSSGGGEALGAREHKGVRKLAARLLRAKSADFVPYDPSFPERPIPQTVPRNTIGIIRYMAGYAMTFRRTAVVENQFEEMLERYAAGEDQDLSYRVSRKGALVNAVHARLCHLHASGGRLAPFTVAALAALNPVALHRKHSSDLKLSQRRLVGNLMHRAGLCLLRDVNNRRWTLPYFTGVVYSLWTFPKLWALSPEELETWYPEFQRTLIQKSR